jgi:signal transduction histidine kinase
VEREVAGDLDEAARAWLGGRQRQARDRLAVVAAVALATLAAALLLLRGLAGRRPEPAAAAAATVPGLARRGQVLADRQLQLLDELVRDEADPRRQDLLGVDHLATRLRRTTETLLAMAGPDPAGRWAGPVPLDRLLRAAVSEAEGFEHAGRGAPPGQGRRVDLLTTGEVEVAGAAGADLVHLLAELLDNAAACSPPATPIVVTAAGDGDGHLIEVADRGFGVRLDRSPAGGVTAAVRLPAELLSAGIPAPARPS